MNDEWPSFRGSLNINFYEDSAFESLEHCSEEEEKSIIARNALRFLMMGYSESWKEMVSVDILKSIFVQRDPELMRELRKAFQQGFDYVFSQLEGKELNQSQMEQVHFYLSNCLSLLPYSDLTPYELIRIPQYINHQWVLVEYHVQPIELTQNNKQLKDNERVFAYGLEPLEHEEAISHLIFMGTTYPAGQGFFTQVSSDLQASETVGRSLYLSGRRRVKEWLKMQQPGVHVCGVSLGGNLSYLFAMNMGDFFSRVEPLNPVGLYALTEYIDHDRWDLLENKPQVTILRQREDMASSLGFWKPDWKMVLVTPPEDKGGPNSFYDHFMNYAGFEGTTFTEIDPIRENEHNRVRNFLLYGLGRSIIYYLFIAPYNTLIRPIENQIRIHKVHLVSCTLALIAVGVLVGLVMMGIVSPLFFTVALITVVLAFSLPLFVDVLCPSVFSTSTAPDCPFDYANLHDPALARNAELDLYSKEQEIEFTLSHKELGDYYKAMRLLLKNKDFLPEDESKCLKGTDISKREVLSKIEEEGQLSLKTTKAKGMHIKQVLTFVHHLGLENEKLRNKLQENYCQYRIGKTRV